jgi:hypothetical protein
MGTDVYVENENVVIPIMSAGIQFKLLSCPMPTPTHYVSMLGANAKLCSITVVERQKLADTWQMKNRSEAELHEVKIKFKRCTKMDMYIF